MCLGKLLFIEAFYFGFLGQIAVNGVCTVGHQDFLLLGFELSQVVFKVGFGAIGCHGDIYFCVWGIFSLQGYIYFGVWGNWQSGMFIFKLLGS